MYTAHSPLSTDSERTEVRRYFRKSFRTSGSATGFVRRHEPLGHVRGRQLSNKLSEKEPRDETYGNKPRSIALKAHVGRRTMSSREGKEGGAGQEVVCFVACRVHAYYLGCAYASYYRPNTRVCQSDRNFYTDYEGK